MLLSCGVLLYVSLIRASLRRQSSRCRAMWADDPLTLQWLHECCPTPTPYAPVIFCYSGRVSRLVMDAGATSQYADAGDGLRSVAGCVSLGAEEVSDCGFLEGALGVPGLPYFDVRRSLARYRRGWRARTFAMEAGVRIKSRSSKPGAFCGGDGPEWAAQAIYCRSHRHVLFF
jgi:hypothetical protein